MTREDLNRIHAQGKAIKGRYYKTSDGKLFIGVDGGRVKQVTEASKVYFQSSNSIQEKNVQKAIEELLSQLDSIADVAYKEFTYDVNGNITDQLIYQDDSLSTLLFTIVYTYTGDDLTTIEITREIDSLTITKTLTYDVDGNLTSLNIE